MANPLCIQISTVAAALNGLGKASTTRGRSCNSGSSTVFGSSVSVRKNFQGLESSTAGAGPAVNTRISKFRISSKLRSGANSKGDVVDARSSAAKSTWTIPKGSDLDEEELKGLSENDRMEVIADAEMAMDIQRELMLEQPENLESRGKEEDHPYANLHVGERWPEIQGKNRWAGLLDPMDPVLRGEVMRYGEFAQATYDAFDYDTHSKYCGSCRYSKSRLLERVGLTNRGYEVTDYLYATSGVDHPLANIFRKVDFDDTDDFDADEVWDPESNWIGFVAVATDEEEIARLGRRDIVIVWRGTVTKLEWLENLRNYLSPTGFDFNTRLGSSDIKMEAGFLRVYDSKHPNSQFTKKSARDQVHLAVQKLVKKYKNEKLTITVTGHSLGSALAHVCAYDLAENNWHYRQANPQDKNHSIPITVFSFAGPRVGNDAFRDRMDELGVNVLRVVNKHDQVTKLPGLLLNEKWEFLEKHFGLIWNFVERLPWTYTHCGVELRVDNLVSPYLRRTKDPVNAHNLEAYIHLVSGYHGEKKEFKLAMDRDIALINKASNFLNRRLYIPPAWRQEENKGLMFHNGRWVPRLRDPQDEPVPEDLIEEPSVDLSRSSSTTN